MTKTKQSKEDKKLLEIINDDEYARLFKEYHPSKSIEESESDWETWDRLNKIDKWKKWEKFLPIIKKCSHFGEVNIFNLVPITCNGFTTEEIVKLIKQKNIKSWLILDIGCLLKLDIDKIDVKFYFAPIDDYSVPSFEATNKIIEFIHDHTKIGNILVSCMGGHGRTGIVLSIWAGLNEIEKPIEYVRKTYCEEAVETLSQEMFINIYLRYLKSL